MFEDKTLGELCIIKEQLVIALSHCRLAIQAKKGERGKGRPSLGVMAKKALVAEWKRHNLIDKRLSISNKYMFLESNPRFKHPTKGFGLDYDWEARIKFEEDHGFDPLENLYAKPLF